MLSYFLLHFAPVQTWVVKQVAGNFSKKLKTRVSIKAVDFSFFSKLDVQGLMIEDQSGDTLLFAKSAKLKITDWFFMHDNFSITYAELDHALVNLNRKDSVWNYAFIINYFGSSKSTGTKSAGPEIDFKEGHFRDIRFNMKDGWVGQDMIASMGKMDIFFDSVLINTNKMVIREISLETPLFAMSDYPGRRPSTTGAPQVIRTIPVASALQWNNSGLDLTIKKLSIKNGIFRSDQYTERERYADRFDGQHIFLSSLRADISNLRLQDDTLSAKVFLSADERSGFKVKKLQAVLKFTPDIMEFSNLDLITNSSRLGNYYAMRYNNFTEDMKSFLEKVRLEGHFSNSTLHTDDLAFFAPALSNWNRSFQIEGNAKGTIDNLTAKAIRIKSGPSYFEGNVTLRGLPDIKTTFIDIESKSFKTNYTDLAELVPSLKTVTKPRLSQLGNISFTGNFTGFINDFVTYGTISTAMGTVSADLNMKLPDAKPPQYSGRLLTDNFRLGDFLDNKALGDISFTGKVNGQGFNLKELDANFDGEIRSLAFNNYKYQNIIVNGNFAKYLFDGNLKINDPNLQLNYLKGTLSFAGKKEIALNFLADLGHADFKKLGITNVPVSLTGLFSLNFTGNTIDNFLGTAKVTNALLIRDSTRLSFDSLTLSSYIRDDKKYLSLRSNDIDAELYGKFNIAQLPDAFKFFLNRYYPTYIKKPNRAVVNQDFSFDIKTRAIDQFISLVDKRLSGFNNSHLSGSLNLAASRLAVNAFVPEFSYDGRTFNDISVTGEGNYDSLRADVTTNEIRVSDSLLLPSSRLSVTAMNDVSEIHLKTRTGKTFNDAELNASVQSFSDGVKIHFFPSSFIVNDRRWLLSEDGELTLRKRFLDASAIRFVQDKQEIVISTELDDVTDETHIVAQIQNVDLGDFAPFVLKNPRLEGRITGRAVLSDPFGRIRMELKAQADSFKVNDRFIGRVDLEGNANTVSGLINFKATSQEAGNNFAINGNYNYKDSVDGGLNLDFMGKRVNLNILESFLGTIFSKMAGFAETNLRIYSRAGRQYITGRALLLNDTVRVAFTQCDYVIRDQVIKFEENRIDFGELTLTDTLNHTGLLTGRIYHEFFDNLSFDKVRLVTDRLLVLNTTSKENETFYGHVIAQASLDINGPTSNLVMDIGGAPSQTDSSHIYLATGNSKEGSTVDYLEFIQFGAEMENEISVSENTNIIVNLLLHANPSCKVDVILDEETQDIIKGQGNGNINIRVGTREPMNIRGTYELTGGEYTFNFQTFLKRPFTLNNGSISWNGDPLEALIDIEAEYLAENVDLSSLSSGGKLVQKEDVTVVSHLTGYLQAPKISFEFRLADRSEAARDDVIVKRLTGYASDENEMYKQVASLLLFNAFLTSEQNFLSGSNTIAFVTNTIGGVISGWLTNVFNRQLEKATKGLLSTYIDVNPTFDLQQDARQLQANVKAGLRLLLSSRLVLLLGGNLDYNNSASAQQADRRGLISPDLSLEWLLNKDGSIRVVGFNRRAFDFTLTQRNRSGVQLTYRKDINRISDLLRSKKRIEAIEEKKRRKVKAGI